MDILNSEFGAHIIQTDEVAKRLMEPGKVCYKKVVEFLGESILNPDGTINRPAMAAQIFGDEKKRLEVNRLTHPEVWREAWDEAARAKAALVVVEAAILGEEFRDNCQEMWYVYTSRENRVRRLAENRGYSEEKSLGVMESQASEEEFRAFCDHVIDNNGTPEETRRQIYALLTEQRTEEPTI